MLSLFRNNIFLLSLLMLLYVFLLRLYSILEPIAYNVQSHDGYLNLVIYNAMTAKTQAIFAIVLVYIQAILLNWIFIKNGLSKDIGLVPGILWILLVSIVPEPSHLPPSLIAVTFLLIGMYYVLQLYNKNNTAAPIFSAGLYFGIASLFYFPLVYFFVVSVVSIIILKSFTFRERLQHLIGWLMPISLLYVWQFYISFDRPVLPNYFHEQFSFISLASFPTLPQVIILTLSLVLIGLSIFNYSRFTSKKDIVLIKKIDILFWTLLYSGVVVFFYQHLDVSHLIIAFVPLSYFVASMLLSIKNLVLAELLHFFVIGILVYINYL